MGPQCFLITEPGAMDMGGLCSLAGAGMEGIIICCSGCAGMGLFVLGTGVNRALLR